MIAILCGGLIGGLAAVSLIPSNMPLTTAPLTSQTESGTTLHQESTQTPTATGLAVGNVKTVSFGKPDFPPKPLSKPDGVSLSGQAPSKAPMTEATKTVSVGRGDTLMKVLTRAGADANESHRAISALSEVFDPRRLKVGQDITLNFDIQTEDDKNASSTGVSLVSISLAQDVDRQVAAIRTPDNGFEVKETVISLNKTMVRASGTITNSLFLSAAEAGLPTKVILRSTARFKTGRVSRK